MQACGLESTLLVRSLDGCISGSYCSLSVHSYMFTLHMGQKDRTDPSVGRSPYRIVSYNPSRQDNTSRPLEGARTRHQRAA